MFTSRSIKFTLAKHVLCLRPLTRNRHTNQGQPVQTIFEIICGAGGSEAMLFANEMSMVYSTYFTRMKWPHLREEHQMTGIGGTRLTRLIVNAQGSFEGLIQEAGVHRVQRVPKTEKYGRMHTSTITVSVVPKTVLDIRLNEKDVEQQTKRASGPGGQHVNKTESAVRLLHKPSGLTVECQESRFQIENRKIALRKLLEKLQSNELEKISSQSSKMRRMQVGNADRNEKIRTYNFPQDRITDHRLGKSYHNLKALFDGDVLILEKIIKDYHDG